MKAGAIAILFTALYMCLYKWMCKWKINTISDLHVHIFLSDYFYLIFSSASKVVLWRGFPGNHKTEGSPSRLTCSRLLSHWFCFPCLFPLPSYEDKALVELSAAWESAKFPKSETFHLNIQLVHVLPNWWLDPRRRKRRWARTEFGSKGSFRLLLCQLAFAA